MLILFYLLVVMRFMYNHKYLESNINSNLI